MELLCLTLWQPWASAIALGFKTIETRPWGVGYRGPLGIHAGKSWDREAARLLPDAAVEHGALRRGALIAVADLADVYRCTNQADWDAEISRHQCPSDWFQAPKYFWDLRDIQEIEPVPLRGWQGLWTWSGEIKKKESSDAEAGHSRWDPEGRRNSG